MSGADRLRFELAEVRLARWHRRTVYAAFVAVGATGVVWTLSHDVLHLSPNALERITLVIHGGAAFLTLMAFGSLIPHHMRLAWATRRNRASGLASVASLFVLALSAYGLYYLGEDGRAFTKWLHIVIGVGACAVIPTHVWLGRRRRWR